MISGLCPQVGSDIFFRFFELCFGGLKIQCCDDEEPFCILWDAKGPILC